MDITGTWEADETSLTLAFPDDSPFCPGGELLLEGQLDGDTLTSDVVGGDCPEPIDVGPPSPGLVVRAPRFCVGVSPGRRR